MPVTIPAEIAALLADPATVKILATVDAEGNPHAVEKRSLHLAEDGTIHHLELLESSNTNRNLVRGIWFDGKVAIALRGSDGRNVQIKGRPIKTHITGALFQRAYAALRAQDSKSDLAAIWVIEPLEVIDQGLEARRAREDGLHPTFIHLDRLATTEGTSP